MSQSKSVLKSLGFTALAATLAFGASNALAEQKTGTVKQYLMNPDGRVDGLLLEDGTQVHFPPHLSEGLVASVAKSDPVKIEGSKVGSAVLRADKIENTKTGKFIVDKPPVEKGRPPGPPPHGPGTPGGPKGPLAGLTELSVSGTVTSELNGRKGEVNGVVLSDDTIVHFGPRLLENSKVKTTKGSKIKVTGFGTKNDYGQSIEATDVSNQ